MRLSTIKLDVPDDFPTQGYEKIHDNMHIQKDVIPEKWSEFAGAWLSVAYKFIALAQNDENYTVSIRKYGGGAPSLTERYNQDYALFNFFVISHALLESLFYSLYVIASIKNPEEFPMAPKQIQKLHPETIQKKFNEYYKNEPITEYLGEIVVSTKYQNLKKIRNTLIHRTMPSRTQNLSTHRKIPDTWKTYNIPTGRNIPDIWMIINIPTDDQLTASFRIWLSKVVLKMMDLMNEFILR